MSSPDLGGFDQLRELGQIHAQQREERAAVEEALAHGTAEVILFQPSRPGEPWREMIVPGAVQEVVATE